MKKLELRENIQIPSYVREQFQVLYSNICLSEKNPHIICLTGADQGCGTSLIAWQLACTIATHGKKVLLLDCDMRNSSLPGLLGYEAGVTGLSEIMDMKSSPSKAMYTTELKNLFLMPTGTIPENPGMLFRKQDFEDLLESLASVMDYVIIDTPAVTVAGDVLTIAPECDASLIVLAAGELMKEEAKERIQSLKACGGHFLGIILNKAESGV